MYRKFSRIGSAALLMSAVVTMTGASGLLYAQPVIGVMDPDTVAGESDDADLVELLDERSIYCNGDGFAVDTEAELAEFASYDSDDFYVLDDDDLCNDDERLDSYGYSAPIHPQVRMPGVLPAVAAGRAIADNPPSEPEPLSRRTTRSVNRQEPVALTPPTESNSTSHRVTRSLGGQRVRDREVPWQVQIFQPWTHAQLSQWGLSTGSKSLWEFQHLCGATLIADNWALTAAHCLPPDAARTGYRVRLGAVTIHNESRYTYRIDRVVPFSRTAGPSANGVWRIHDISLIHFVDDRGVGRPPVSQVQPISIDRGPALVDNDPVMATGWGRVSNATNLPTSTMMKVQLNIVANDRCARGVWGPEFVHDQVICAAAPGRQTCQGDSGGPLVNAEGPPRLIGVVSWNNADCLGDVGRQGIYTRVASYAAWIDRTIRSR